ncbi:MAG: CoA pyrophosphatase, partial [Oxalobacter sp.]|nr:CoA pyrophosphatase [Oxalobacter sp.]
GGRVDEEDCTHIETALREAKEEIGVDRECVEIIGLMPEYRTGSGYRVIPVVSIVHPPFDVTLNRREVDDAFELPFSFFMTGTNYQVRSAEFPNGLGRRSFYTIPCEGRFVWGATAAMLRNLYHFILA